MALVKGLLFAGCIGWRDRTLSVVQGVPMMVDSSSVTDSYKILKYLSLASPVSILDIKGQSVIQGARSAHLDSVDNQIDRPIHR